ncbi:hypothetical protein [Nonomuraea polychroma]|nr:hypothetical protein [Nonomuraea polychroma]
MSSFITNRPSRPRAIDDTPAGDPESISAGAVRWAGLGLAAGTLTWAMAIFLLGPTGVGVTERIVDRTGLLFQLSVFCLLWIPARTRAIGISRAASIALGIEAVLLGLASFWSLLHGILPDGIKDETWLMVLGLCWPLSMLGMAAISVKLAFAARWHGVMRWWPLVATRPELVRS